MSVSIIILENGSVLKKIQIINKEDIFLKDFKYTEDIILDNLQQTILKISETYTSIFDIYYDIDVNDSLLIIEIINEFEKKYNIMLVGLSNEENEEIKTQLLIHLNKKVHLN